MHKKAPEIFYSDEGSGHVIVFLHGFIESNEIWNHYAEKLSENFRVICIDLPGHGDSSMLDEVHTMDLMATEVRNILEILGVNKCLLVGHSMGGYVTMSFAAKYSQFLKGIILLHSQAGADSDEEKANRNRVIELIKNDHLSFITSFYPGLFAAEKVDQFQKQIDWLRSIGKKMSPEAVIAAVAGMRDREDHVKTLENLFVPAMVIAGDKDTRIPLEKVKKQIVNAKKVKLEILNGIGHMGFLEAEEDVFVLIRNFAQQIFKKKK